MGEIAADLLGDPPGFDRARLPAMDRAIAGFFTRHLLPWRPVPRTSAH